MPISSSDRCTRISPSAILDDRLDGKDLEWARDHLRRCEACRDRVEEFREMLLRVGRLPKATVGSTAIDEAYMLAVPERLREEAGVRSFELAPAESNRTFAPIIDVPTPVRPEVTSVPDLMTELERQIFHDEPAQDHPTPMETAPEASEGAGLPLMNAEEEPSEEPEPPQEVVAAAPEAVEPAWRQVPVDSHQVVEPPAPMDTAETDWSRLLETIANSPEPETTPAAIVPHASAEPPMPAVPVPSDLVEAAPVTAAEAVDAAPPTIEHRNVIFDGEPAITFDEPAEPATAAPPPKRDTAMRLFVGFGAAAVVLLAAILYEGGFYLKNHNLGATAPTARASVKASKTPHPSASPSIAPTPAQPPVTVLFTLGNGVAGNAVFRIRPGTAVAGYTRLVFDMHGSGLPTMQITQTDASHIQVIFKNATVTGVPVNGISSYQIAAIEPGVQNGADGSFTIDLAHPVRVTAFTLPATGGYAWRLVVDLHTS